MARKLPWATKDSPVVVERRQKRESKKRQASVSDDERVDVANSKGLTALRVMTKRTNCMKLFNNMDVMLTKFVARTPSTSPPPGPPVEEYVGADKLSKSHLAYT